MVPLLKEGALPNDQLVVDLLGSPVCYLDLPKSTPASQDQGALCCYDHQLSVRFEGALVLWKALDPMARLTLVV